MLAGFQLMVRGYDHIEKNTPRQDYAATYVDQGGWAMAAVSDGHGGSDYFRSHIGSRLAVESAAIVIKEVMRDKKAFIDALRGDCDGSGRVFRPKSPDDIFRSLESSIVHHWYTLVGEFHESHPLGDNAEESGVPTDESVASGQELTDASQETCEAESVPIPYEQDGISLDWEKQWMEKNKVKIREDRIERLYGCTLLVAVMAPEFCFCVQIGDGCCVVVRGDGHAEMMIPQDDDDRPANITDSLCESTALDKFRHAYMLAPDWERVLCEDRDEEYEAEVIGIVKGYDTAADEADGIVGEANVDGNTDDEQETPAQIAEPAPTPPSAAPVGIVLSTDGLINCFDSHDVFLSFNRRILSFMGPSDRSEFGVALEENLAERSRVGSKDDISIALVFDEEMDYEAVRPR